MAVSSRGVSTTTVVSSLRSGGTAGAVISHGASYHVARACVWRPSHYDWFGEFFLEETVSGGAGCSQCSVVQ